MKLLANILFEIFHRYVYDYCLQSKNSDFGRSPYKKANRNNKYRKHNNLVLYIYNKLDPYFKGWRLSLKINLWWVKRYRRYSPESIKIMDYDFNRLSIWSKFIYSIRYQWYLQKQNFNHGRIIK